MKQKVSITIDQDKASDIKNLIESGRYRNRSHVIEYALERFLKEEND